MAIKLIELSLTGDKCIIKIYGDTISFMKVDDYVYPFMKLEEFKELYLTLQSLGLIE